MGIQITSIGRGSPGHNGVPGDTFTNKDLLNRLTKGLSFWQRAALTFAPGQLQKAERGLQVFEKVSGIKERQMLVTDNPYPNECLATAACEDAIKRQKEVDPDFDRSKIGGLIVVTDTQDTVFPISGKIVAKALGIQPSYFTNGSLACASIVNAIEQAASWMHFDQSNSCEYILVSTCDVTSRLHQPTAVKQPFLFGDQAVAFILKKTDGPGGFKVSNTFLDTDAPGIIHKSLYTGDTESSRVQFQREDFGNDGNLSSFGKYEAGAIAGLYRTLLRSTEGSEGGIEVKTRDGVSGRIHEDEFFLPPQVAKKIAKNAAKNAGIDCEDFEGHLARSSVPNFAITGAAGTPLALSMLEDDSPGAIRNRWSAIMCGIGGLNALVSYDPTAVEPLSYDYYVDTTAINDIIVSDEVSDESNGNGHLPKLEGVVEVEEAGKKEMKPIDSSKSTTTADIAEQIRATLSL